MSVVNRLTETSQFSREITFRAAYDKRNPEPSKNYGIHGVDMTWLLKGPLGVVQFVVSTNWYLPHVQREFDAKRGPDFDPYMFHKPSPTDIGYHSPKPMYEGQEPLTEDCGVLGGRCYYDGSGLQAEDVFKILLEEGSEGVWKEMERRYYHLFETKEAA